MSFEISRPYNFCAAHRLEGHPKCGRLHGHNYKLIVHVKKDVLESQWVMDFGDLDRYVRPLVDAMDHRYLVSDKNVTKNCPYAEVAELLGHAYFVPVCQTTAEAMAEWLAAEISHSIETFEGPGYVVQIELHETERGVVKYPASF